MSATQVHLSVVLAKLMAGADKADIGWGNGQDKQGDGVLG